MKTYIAYESRTGNTKMLADVIADVFHDNLVSSAEEAELVFLGSWTDKGSIASSMVEQASALKNKKIFIFGTCGFGKGDYFEQLFRRAASLLDESNEIVGHFYCQGKMPPAVRDRYVSMLRANPEDRRLQVSVENFDAALSHPDNDDLNSLRRELNALLASGKIA